MLVASNHGSDETVCNYLGLEGHKDVRRSLTVAQQESNKL